MWKPLLVSLALAQSVSASPRTSTASPRAAAGPTRPREHAAPATGQQEAIAICKKPRPIRRTVKQHREQLARCYSRETQFRGGADGVVTLHFTVQADGRVTHASAETDLSDTIKNCVLAELRSWTFPLDDEPVRVNYPLHFQLDRTSSR